MAYMIDMDNCSACGTCETDCPNQAIVPKGDSFAIKVDKCTECAGIHDEPQCVANCPSEAIVKAGQAG